MWPPFCLTTSCKWTLAFVTTFRHKSSESTQHNFTMWALSCLFLMKNMFNVTTVLPHNLLQNEPLRSSQLFDTSLQKARGTASLCGPWAALHFLASSEVCEAKRWSHWTCSSLGTIFQPMRINSVADVKCFCNNKNVLCAQSLVWHFVRHPVVAHFKSLAVCCILHRQNSVLA